MADAGRGDDVNKATHRLEGAAEVEYDVEAQRWFVTVGGRPIDDHQGRPLHWLDYSAAYAVKSGLDPAPAPLAGSAFAVAGR